MSTLFGGLTVFDVDASGRMTKLPGTPVLPSAHLYNVAVHPTGPFVFALNPDLATITGFRYDRADGGLAQVAGSPLPIGGAANSFAVDPNGAFIYTSSGPSVGIFTVDPATGALGDGGPSLATTGNAEAVAINPSGRFLYVSHVGQDGIEGFARDGGTFTRMATSPFGVTEVQGGAMVFHPSGWLYNARFNLNGFTIDPSSGALTKIGGSPFATGVGSDPFAQALAIDPSGKYLYVVKNATNALAAFSISPTNGALSEFTATTATLSAAYSVAVAPSGRYLYVGTDFGEIAGFALAPSDGTLMMLGSGPFPISGLQPEIVIVPR